MNGLLHKVLLFCCNKKRYKNVTNFRHLIGFVPIVGLKFSKYLRQNLLNYNNVPLLNDGVRLILYQHLVGLTSVVVNQVPLLYVLNLGARHHHPALPVPQ